ncbi:MAG: TonB-dependent receptor [Nevskia sp.]|nr:TonB-dependent receptor [Nevskia sp.]
MRHEFTRVRTACSGALIILGAATASPAHAQDAAAPAATPPAANDQKVVAPAAAQTANQSLAGTETPSASGDGPEALQEVLVTANKRRESAREVPGAVTVISGGKLETIGASNFQDFATYVPGLSSASDGVGENQIAIRGITSGAQISSTVGVYVDESPVGSSSAFALGSYGLDFNVFDLQRLEVLSGPQGTLYGASTLGGLLKYVTMPPDLGTYGASVQSEASDTINGGINHSERAVINLPIIPNHLAIRVDGIAENDAGFVDNPNRNLKDVNASKTRGGRVSLLGSLNPDLSLRLSVMQQSIDRNGNSAVDRDPITHQPVQGKYDESALIDEPFTSHFLLYSGLLTWNLHWAQLTSMSSWQDIATTGTLDETANFGGLLHTGNLITFVADDAATVKKYTQEIRLASPDSKVFEWQIGAFYTVEHADDFLGVSADLARDDKLLGLIPVGLLGPDLTLPLLEEPLQSTYRELAGFADATAHLTRKLDFTLGVRYSGNRQGYQQQEGGVLGLLSGITGPLTGASSNTGGSSRANVATYLFSPRYHIDPSTMIYGRVASGYRPGGPNYIAPAPFPSGPATFDPDTVWNYELGTKASFFHHRATVDFDVFYVDWNKILLLTNLDGNNTIENGGKAQVRGAELSASFKPLRGLTVGGNMSYSHAKLAEDVPALDAKSGQRLPLSPRFSGALTADYSVPFAEYYQGTAGLSYRFVGNRPVGFDGSSTNPQYMLGAYEIVDLRCGVQTPFANVSLFFKNVFNKLGEVSADASALQNSPDAPVRVAITQPRTIGLMVTLGWSSDR